MIRAYRWYGGKLRMVDKLNFLIPPHIAYYEPFMGSASLLLNHPRSELEVLNDLDSDLVCFMKTLADRERGKILVDRLSQLWFGKGVFDEAMECKKRHFKGLDEIERSVYTYILISQSFNATRKNFSKKLYRDTGAYRDDIMFHLPKVYERMNNVRVLNMDGIDLLDRIKNNPNAFAYVDPPYRHELRGVGANKAYSCELPRYEQVRLLKTIRESKCKILLSGYRCDGNGVDLYDRYLIPHGWKSYKLAEVTKSCQTTAKKDTAEEFIWANYELPFEARYVISLKEYNSLKEN